ncbi:hypothetical protein ACFFUE_07155 [Bergeyella porcorum]|uniref:hypothetical protein n=1 Tax=Bergeyella porcorum TaxID=1735111 RepID=UPI0035ED650B
MTTQEKLQAVTEQIRKDIPRLMELSEGCLVKSTIGDDYLKIVGNISNSYVLYDGLGVHEIRKEDFPKYFKIVGHEPMINDVIEWAEMALGDRIYISSNPDGLFLSYSPKEDYGIICYWDLSKPYLKDQSDKLKEFLYNLMNK